MVPTTSHDPPAREALGPVPLRGEGEGRNATPQDHTATGVERFLLLISACARGVWEAPRCLCRAPEGNLRLHSPARNSRKTGSGTKFHFMPVENVFIALSKNTSIPLFDKLIYLFFIIIYYI